MTSDSTATATQQARASEFAAIKVLLERRAFQDAETRLREVLHWADMPDANRGLALSMLGDALDGLGRRPEAFAAYRQAKPHALRFSAVPDAATLAQKRLAALGKP